MSSKLPQIEIISKQVANISFMANSCKMVDGWHLYIDGIFIKLDQKRENLKHLASQIELHPSFITHYAGVFESPYEIVDMLERRKMSFRYARLIKESTLNNQYRYIFAGNVNKVSCAFRFTFFKREDVDTLLSYIEDKNLSKGLTIALDTKKENVDV